MKYNYLKETGQFSVALARQEAYEGSFLFRSVSSSTYRPFVSRLVRFLSSFIICRTADVRVLQNNKALKPQIRDKSHILPYGCFVLYVYYTIFTVYFQLFHTNLPLLLPLFLAAKKDVFLNFLSTTNKLFAMRNDDIINPNLHPSEYLLTR